MPVATTPGRTGFGPELALSYDSGSGNGLFGYGWSLGLPSVTRKTDKGLPEYRDAEESDVYLLSGAEDLVPVLDPDEGSWRRVELERTLDGDSYLVHPYRPRTEGLFARIERWTRRSDGRIHWRSITRENVTTLYGKTADARVADPMDATRVFQWLVCESHDDRGNAMVYEYAAEDSAGIDSSQAHESNRTTGSRSARRYPKRIRYGNRTSRLDDPDLDDPGWMFEVVFDYGGHDPDAPTPSADGEWLVRRDPFSSYRAGFEQRTYRLCQRALMFHHFPDEDGVGADCLVRSTDFTYRDDVDDGRDDPREGHPLATFLASVTETGYRRREEGGYTKRSMPPVEFTYSRFEIDEDVRYLDVDSLENLPAGLGEGYRWVDLDGEGISGVLTEQAGDLYWKPNLGGGRLGPVERVEAEPSTLSLSGGRQQLLDLAGDGSLDLVELAGSTPGFYERTWDERWSPLRSFRRLPSVDWGEPNLRFVDLDGNGHADVFLTEDEVFTWYPSRGEAGFGPARRVPKALDEEEGPRLVLADGTQSIHLADFSGDGLVDLARIRNGEVCYWPNLGHGRFGAKVTMDDAPWFDTEEDFDQGRIRLTDVDGSGTTDILYLGRDAVRIHLNESGNRWSAGRELEGLPAVDDLSSVTTVDLLGKGTACLVWSSSHQTDAGRQLRYVDLMAEGKPHLLVRVENNLGAETHVRYAPSTKFYLADKAAGKPWATRLPFPVHVVERVETHDRVSRNRFVTRYAYHHGHFDGEEREFRGFGLVEQWDTEEFAALSETAELPDAANVDEASHVPPVLTKTWYHTGAFREGERISRHHEDEYYREGDASLGEAGLTDDQLRAMLLPDTRLPGDVLLPDGRRLPAELSAEEARQAARALRGSLLRREVYGRDGTDRADRPYTVSEHAYEVEMLQPVGPHRHAVFFSRPRETVDHRYERELYDVEGERRADPRVAHELTLEVDAWGDVLQSATVTYGRRFPDPELEPADQEQQARTLVTWTEAAFTNPVLDLEGPDPGDDVHRGPVPYETRGWELVNVAPDASEPLVTNLFRPDELRAKAEATRGGERDLPYHDWESEGAGGGEPHRRLLQLERTLFQRDDLDGALPLGELPSRALPFDSYRLAFTPDLLEELYRRETEDGEEDLLSDPAAVLTDEGGYVSGDDLQASGLFPVGDPDGRWWAPSGRIAYSPTADDTAAEEAAFARSHFFLPRRFLDPFGNATLVDYDDHDLQVQQTRDPAGNLTTAGERDPDTGALAIQGNDYRVLQPGLVMDPNRNRSAAAFDALGRVAGTAVMGKPEGPSEGDSLEGFEVELAEAAVLEQLADPLDDPHALLGRATTRVVHDLFAYRRTRDDAEPEPLVAHTLARETHDADLGDGETARIQLSFVYSDGFGREIQKKTGAEPGPVPRRDGTGERVVGPDGRPEMTEADVSPRWVGSGWMIFNNKGDPVRQYEPFFTDTHRWEYDPRIGVSPVLFYDPVGRVVATLYPNHTWEKTVFDPWRREAWDAIDTVRIPDPASDPDVGDFFARLPESEHRPTWHALRVDPAHADAAALRWPDGATRSAEMRAAEKTAELAETPTVTHADARTRPFLSVAHNRTVYGDGTAPDGGPDASLRTRISYDAEGHPRQVVDARGRRVMRYEYGRLGNRIRQASMEAGERWMLYEVTGRPIYTWDSRSHRVRTVYDALRRPSSSLLSVDGGEELLVGSTTYGESRPSPETNNLRGRLAELRDQAGVVTSEAYDFKGNLLRSRRRLAEAVGPEGARVPAHRTTVDWSGEVEASAESYVGRTWYDALDRPVQLVPPHVDGPGGGVAVIRPIYDEAGLTRQVHLWLDRADDPPDRLDPDTADLAVVADVEYDAKGQRQRVRHGNGTVTRYRYDPLTFRMTGVSSRRDAAAFPDDCPEPRRPGWPGCDLQRLRYTHDPVGNVVSVRDGAQQALYFRNRRVTADRDYTYDALYQLIEATGREHLGQTGASPRPHSYGDTLRGALPHPADGRAVGRYRERYAYDAAGNMTAMRHRGSDPAQPGWTREFAYGEPSQLEPGETSNRLTSTTAGGTTARYSTDGDGYDAHGNLLRMPHLSALEWDHDDHLGMTRRQAVNAEDEEGAERDGETTWYVYDAGGRRVRTVTELPGGQLKDERVYLQGVEIYRRHAGSPLVRETLHVREGKRRVALVETRTEGDEPATPRRLIRYQHTDHLESVTLELDGDARVVSYEEYTPFGSTSMQAVAGLTETPKRYRYTGKERDEATGLYYHGARYYAPWLARWLSPDPVRSKASANLYLYVENHPVSFVDPDGRRRRPATDEEATVSPAASAPGERGRETRRGEDASSGGRSTGPGSRARGSASGGEPTEEGSEGGFWSTIGRALTAVGEGVLTGLRAIGRGLNWLGEVFGDVAGGLREASDWMREWLPGLIAAPLAGLTEVLAGTVRALGGALAWEGSEVTAGLADAGLGALSIIGLKEVVGDEWIPSEDTGLPTGLHLPRTLAEDLQEARDQVPSDAYKNGMHAWHAATNAAVTNRVGPVGAPLLWLAGLIHESPVDWTSFKAEQRFQGTVNHILDSFMDIIANTFGILLGLLLPRKYAIEAAAFLGNYIPGPGDPDPAFGGGGEYTGDPTDAWGQYP